MFLFDGRVFLLEPQEPTSSPSLVTASQEERAATVATDEPMRKPMGLSNSFPPVTLSGQLTQSLLATERASLKVCEIRKWRNKGRRSLGAQSTVTGCLPTMVWRSTIPVAIDRGGPRSFFSSVGDSDCGWGLGVLDPRDCHSSYHAIVVAGVHMRTTQLITLRRLAASNNQLGSFFFD